MKKISTICLLFAVLLSDCMCAVVAYNYCALLWGSRYAGSSAPASTAFLYAIPFIAGILVCLALACIFRRRTGQTGAQEH